MGAIGNEYEAMTYSSPLASWLRAQPTLVGTPPEFDLETLPDDPVTLFAEWIVDAAERGVAEPHAATLATVDADCVPDARTVIVKDVTARGWAFAGPRSSQKGSQLAVSPAAALNFWWQPIRRAVRLRGVVREATAAESEADLAARSGAARAGMRAGEWVRWWLEPTSVEFWQGAADRRHIRIVYSRNGDGWVRSLVARENNERG